MMTLSPDRNVFPFWPRWESRLLNSAFIWKNIIVVTSIVIITNAVVFPIIINNSSSKIVSIISITCSMWKGLVLPPQKSFRRQGVRLSESHKTFRGWKIRNNPFGQVDKKMFWPNRDSQALMVLQTVWMITTGFISFARFTCFTRFTVLIFLHFWTNQSFKVKFTFGMILEYFSTSSRP